MKIIFALAIAVACASCTSVKQYDVNRSEIDGLPSGGLVTFSDYGNGISYDQESSMYRYDLFIGGFGGCAGSALRHAKPKLDEYMLSNGYKDYVIKEVRHKQSPPTKCQIFVEYIK